MRTAVFAARNRKELLRDPLSLVFGIGLPVFLLLAISTLQKNIAVDIFRIENFAPGIAIFSFSFITLFSGMLVARDRCSSFLARLFASPLTASDYILGYSLPLLPVAILQVAVCFAAAAFFGLSVNANVVLTALVLLPVAALFIGFGLLLGSIFSDKQVGAIASILIQVVAFSSGMWFDLSLFGDTIKAIAYALPFAHAVDATRAALIGQLPAALPHLAWCSAYAIAIFVLAAVVFRRKMRA